MNEFFIFNVIFIHSHGQSFGSSRSRCTRGKVKVENGMESRTRATQPDIYSKVSKKSMMVGKLSLLTSLSDFFSYFVFVFLFFHSLLCFLLFICLPSFFPFAFPSCLSFNEIEMCNILKMQQLFTWNLSKLK